MNLCGYGECACGGHYDEYGEWSPCDDSQRYDFGGDQDDANLIRRYYFWSKEHGVVFSVDHRTDRDERLPGIDYFLTPDEAARAAKDQTIKEQLDKGFLSAEQVVNLLNLNQVIDPVPPPPKTGPRGRRKREFPIKRKPNDPA